MPWITKYAPRTFDDVVGNDDAVYEVRTLMEKQTIPNLLLYGPEGTGKTSLAKCMCSQRHSSDYMYYDSVADHSLRGVRDNIKMFAKCRATGDGFKLVVIDNADQLYPDAQAFLRRVMEIYVKTTRFVFIMRDMHRLTEPIQSRCLVLHISPGTTTEIVKHLSGILQKEGLSMARDELTAIAKQCDGSYRHAIMLLETVCLADGKQAETTWTVPALIGVPEPMSDFLDKFKKATTWIDIYEFIKTDIIDKGYSPSQLLEAILVERVWSLKTYAALGRGVSDIRAGRHTLACIATALHVLNEELRGV